MQDANPRCVPVFMSKIDISDGFHRTGLRPEEVAQLGILFATDPREPPLIGMPLVSPMGWKESPPAFCVATETVADPANQAMNKETLQPPH